MDPETTPRAAVRRAAPFVMTALKADPATNDAEIVGYEMTSHPEPDYQDVFRESAALTSVDLLHFHYGWHLSFMKRCEATCRDIELVW